MVGLFQPVADVDELECLDDPGGKMRMGKAIEVVAPVAALFDQPLDAQLGEVLGDAGGG